MRRAISLLTIVWADAAAAHPGHIIDLAGHNHWIAGGAIGIAIAIGIAGALTGKKKPQDAPEAEAEEQEEAPA